MAPWVKSLSPGCMRQAKLVFPPFHSPFSGNALGDFVARSVAQPIAASSAPFEFVFSRARDAQRRLAFPFLAMSAALQASVAAVSRDALRASASASVAPTAASP